MEIKIHPDELKLGMYVSRLDLPWVDSPFMFQGFQVNSTEEIQKIKDICQYIYVETEKTSPNLVVRLQTISQNKIKSARNKLKNPNGVSLKHQKQKNLRVMILNRAS